MVALDMSEKDRWSGTYILTPEASKGLNDKTYFLPLFQEVISVSTKSAILTM